jgi:hypothetical protein
MVFVERLFSEEATFHMIGEVNDTMSVSGEPSSHMRR